MVGTLTATRTDFQQAIPPAGVQYRGVATYTGPASYSTGGDPIAASDLNTAFGLNTLSVIDDVLPSNPAYNGTNIFEATYNKGTGQFQFFDPSTKAEVTAATNLSGYTIRVEFVAH